MALVESERPVDFAVYRTMHEAGVPVQEVLWLEAGNEPLGQPFFIMERLPDVEASPQTLLSPAFDAGRPKVGARIYEILGAIHRVDWRGTVVEEAIDAPTAASTAGQWVEFGDWSIWMSRSFLNLGGDVGGTDIYHKLQVAVSFDDNKMFTGAPTRDTLQGGEVKELHYRPLNSQAAFLRCGMYGGTEGGTPDGDIWMGMYAGDDVVSGETYDISDPATRLKRRGCTNYRCEVTCGDEVAHGIFETHDPGTWEMCGSGAPGYSLLN